MKRILIAFGTRPEAIKLSSLYTHFIKEKKYDIKLCVVWQHTKILKEYLEKVYQSVDYTINLNKDATIANKLSEIIRTTDIIISENPVDLIIVQGDTLSALGLSIAAHYNQVPIAHLEAGIRSHMLDSPWPEEFNRICIDAASTLHFPPTEHARQNLLKENISCHPEYVVGNTVIDALKASLHHGKKTYKWGDNYCLVTLHRRESFGLIHKNIINAVSQLAKSNIKFNFVIINHPNPNVSKIIQNISNRFDNLFMIGPLIYHEFVALLQKAKLVITDSGGIQEEAAYLGVPAVICRKKTDRPETIHKGNAILAGIDPQNIITVVQKILSDYNISRQLSCPSKVYGEGESSKSIVKMIDKYINEHEKHHIIC